MEPELRAGSRGGGVSMVAYQLTKALANQATVTQFPSFFASPRSYAVNLLKVYSRFAARDFEIIHFNCAPVWHNGSLMLLRSARMTGAATLLNIHGIVQVEYLMDYPRTRKVRSAVNNAMTNILRTCKIVDRIVTYSEFMRNQIVNWYGLKREKIAVIPNGVNLKKFNDCTGKLVFEGDPAILYLGYLSKFKSVDLLICAIYRLRSELPNMKLHIVGQGGQPALELLAKKKQVEKTVIFHGQANPEDTPLYYRSADFCVFPSRRDSAGLTLLEAMASGTPVIASNRGGTQEIIHQGESGILFDPDDADALPKAILALSQDSDLRKRISNNALKTVAKYSWDNIASKYVSLYKDLTQ